MSTKRLADRQCWNIDSVNRSLKLCHTCEINNQFW